MRRWGALALSLASGCAWLGPNRDPSDADRALDVAGELENAHRYAIARGQLGAIADLVGPREASEIRLRACRTYGLEGRDTEERDCYASLLAPEPPSADQDDVAEAREQEARAHRETITEAKDIEPFIIAYAGTDAARRSLIARQADVEDAEGCAGAAGFLERIEDAVTTEQGKPLRLEANVRRAELLLTDCRDADAAVEAARLATLRAEKTKWADDADWIMGRACEKAGKLDDALAAYSRIIEARSTAIPFGSNDSLFLDDAWLAKGLLLEKLGRVGEARDTLRDLIDARDTHLRPKAEEALKRMGVL